MAMWQSDSQIITISTSVGAYTLIYPSNFVSSSVSLSVNLFICQSVSFCALYHMHVTIKTHMQNNFRTRVIFQRKRRKKNQTKQKVIIKWYGQKSISWKGMYTVAQRKQSKQFSHRERTHRRYRVVLSQILLHWYNKSQTLTTKTTKPLACRSHN